MRGRGHPPRRIPHPPDEFVFLSAPLARRSGLVQQTAQIVAAHDLASFVRRHPATRVTLESAVLGADAEGIVVDHLVRWVADDW